MELPEGDNGDATILVRGVHGFARLEVRHLLVGSVRGERMVAVESPAGAFVVVVLGPEGGELQGLDRAGNPVGPPERYDAFRIFGLGAHDLPESDAGTGLPT